jgi:hypothetical protein
MDGKKTKEDKDSYQGRRVFTAVWVGTLMGCGVCTSRPSRYVSMINDNHLVSLMNFNEAKEN